MNAHINGGGEIPFCNGQGFFHNSSWYSFVPTTPFIFIEIIADNCTTSGGNQGVQMGLFSNCTPNTPPIGPLQCDCAAPGQTITLGGSVMSFETYYILVDGCSGSTCDLQMVLTVGNVELPTIQLGTPTTPFTNDPIPTCPGAIMEFFVPPVRDADIYDWSFPPGTTIVSQDCNTITALWGPNEGDVFVSVTNLTNSQTNNSPPTSIIIDSPIYSLTRTYCGSSANGYLFYGDSLLYEEGSYTILIPGSDCDTMVNLIVTNTQPILTLSSSDQTCENEGMATVTITGGVPPFSYEWSNGTTDPTIDNLMGGDYTVTVTGADGCSSEGGTTINILGVFDLTVNSTPTDCDETNGTASVTIIGVVPDPAYAWSNGATDNLITDLSPGFYSVTVTDTETNCQTQESVEVVEDPECSDNCPIYSVSDGNITIIGFNTAATKIRLWSTEGSWQQVFECDFDCNDPNFPATPGTPCNDNNPDTDNDQIQSDGCSCVGTTTTPPTNDCPIYTVNNGTISVMNFNISRTKIRLWRTEGGWQQVFECSFDCSDPTVITGLSGEYHLKIDAFDDDYNYICKVDEDLIIDSGPCVDNDNDGICASSDCDDNNPNFPAEIGTACDDNNPDTTNDQIQSDGCTCAGIPETSDCATIIMTMDDLTIIGNYPNQIIKVFNADWEFVFQCNGDCPNPVVIDNLSEQVYHIKVDAYDSDWNFICEIEEDLFPGTSSASLRDDSADLRISKLTLFPNPTWGAFTLSTKDLNGSGVVKIYNAMGQVIQQRAIKDLRAQDFLKLDLSNNSSGVYYVVVQFPYGKMLTERVVVLNNQ